MLEKPQQIADSLSLDLSTWIILTAAQSVILRNSSCPSSDWKCYFDVLGRFKFITCCDMCETPLHEQPYAWDDVSAAVCLLMQWRSQWFLFFLKCKWPENSFFFLSLLHWSRSLPLSVSAYHDCSWVVVALKHTCYSNQHYVGHIEVHNSSPAAVCITSLVLAINFHHCYWQGDKLS